VDTFGVRRTEEDPMKAATLLRNAIVTSNDACKQVMNDRLATELAVLSWSLPEETKKALFCSINQLEAFQNEEVLPVLNELLVQVVTAYARKDASAMAHARAARLGAPGHQAGRGRGGVCSRAGHGWSTAPLSIPG
jgi:hypothetical protein